MKGTQARAVLKTATLALLSAAACAVVTVFVMRGTLRHDVWTAIAAGIVYLLPLLALQAMSEKVLVRKVDASPFPIDWMIYGGAKLIVALVGAGVGSLLCLLLGIVSNWQDLYIANRIVVVVMVIATCIGRIFQTTRSRLERRNLQLEERIEAESRTLRLHEQDIERAREIQEALMPKQLPQVARCELSAGCQPARIVGGDYYDAIRLGDSSVALAIGDVAGKGMAAALLMSNLQAIVRAFAESGITSQQMCEKANQIISANVATGKYITFFYAVVDTSSMQLEYCNAGHGPPMLHHRDGTSELLAVGGPVLGVFSGASYASGVAKLTPGDRLLLFTDGITEAMNADDEEYGEPRLATLFGRTSNGAEDFRRLIMTEVTEFSHGAFHDDATLLVMTLSE